MRRFMPLGFIVVMVVFGWSDLVNLPPLGWVVLVLFWLFLCACVVSGDCAERESTAGGRNERIAAFTATHGSLDLNDPPTGGSPIMPPRTRREE